LRLGTDTEIQRKCEGVVYDAEMISIADLRAIAEARMEDAKVLAANGRTDGAAYLCGYAVELALKARICSTLNWNGFPETRGEFENFSNFKTHKLDVLLALSGHEQRIKAGYFDDWSAIAKWDPEVRYRVVGQTSAEQVSLIIEAVENLLGTL
jgi:hypothetical protein